MKIKRKLIKLDWLAKAQFGIDVRLLLTALFRIPKYIADLIEFRRDYKGELKLVPSLHDRYSSNGDYEHEYFWQDLYVAKRIYLENTETHLDIGSRIDGFISNLATFRTVEVLDIREQTINIPNVHFQQANLMDVASIAKYSQKYSSISCLHTIEHFGLGRYGDPIMVDGFDVGFKNICTMLKHNGILYIATPISNRSFVEFNSNRVTDYKVVLKRADDFQLKLLEFRTITALGVSESEAEQPAMLMDAVDDYILGLFIFKLN